MIVLTGEFVCSPATRTRPIKAAVKVAARLLDIDASATYLGTSDKRVREMIIRGELPHIQNIPGRSPYLLDIRNLDRWIEAHKS